MVTNHKCAWCGNPLPKGRRKYCCDDCAYKYWQKFQAPLWWNNAKNMALARANYQCEAEGCGRRGGLEVHHEIRLEPWESRHNSPKNSQDNLRVLCRSCHEKAHHPNAGQCKGTEIPKEQLIMELV